MPREFDSPCKKQKEALYDARVLAKDIGRVYGRHRHPRTGEPTKLDKRMILEYEGQKAKVTEAEEALKKWQERTASVAGNDSAISIT